MDAARDRVTYRALVRTAVRCQHCLGHLHELWTRRVSLFRTEIQLVMVCPDCDMIEVKSDA